VLVRAGDFSHNESMESQLASARVLLLAAAVPVAVFLCLRAAGLDIGPALGGGSSTPSSDVQVVAEFNAPVTSGDDLFDRRGGSRASVRLGPAIGDAPTTRKLGGRAGGSGSGGGGEGGKNNDNGGGGGTNPTPPPPPALLEPVRDALKPVTDATGTGPAVDEVTGTVEGTLDDVTPALPETPSLP
jgi:hypothetical protein